MDHELLRLECMKTAISEGYKGPGAIERAQQIFDFLRVGHDEASEARRIVAGMSNGQVVVRGVGSDVHDLIGKPKRPTDYVPE